MAKCAFSKLGLKLNNSTTTIGFNGVEIEIKSYLPIEDKMELVTNVLNNSVDDNGYYNCGRLDVFRIIEIIKFYTNITFTDKQQEDICKLYDLIVGNGLWDLIKDNIPEEEYDSIEYYIFRVIDNIYSYNNSVRGVLDTVSADYSNMNLDASEIQKKLGDPNNLSLLRDVLTNLG